MTPRTFSERQFRIADNGAGVVVDVPGVAADVQALRDALAWRRTELSMAELDVDGVLVLRALIALDDRLLASVVPGIETALLTLSHDDVTTLCELACTYTTLRDVEAYQPEEERDRIARLRGMSGGLMDTCSEFGAAEDEARAKALLTNS